MIELLVGAIALVAVGGAGADRSSASACARWAGSSRRPARSPPATSPSASRTAIRAPRSAGSGAALNAMLSADRAGVRRARSVGEPAAPVRGRRLARAAHAADVGARLRGAVPARRRRPARRPGRSRCAGSRTSGPHGRAGRRPAAAGPARPGPAAGTGAGRPRRRWSTELVADARAMRARLAAGAGRHTARSTVVRRRRRGCARPSATCSPTPARTARPKPTVIALPSHGDGDEATLEVADDGPGIDPEDLRPGVRAVLPRRPLARRAPAAAPASGCRSWHRSPRPTAAGSTWRARRERAAASGW